MYSRIWRGDRRLEQMVQKNSVVQVIARKVGNTLRETYCLRGRTDARGECKGQVARAGKKNKSHYFCVLPSVLDQIMTSFHVQFATSM